MIDKIFGIPHGYDKSNNFRKILIYSIQLRENIANLFGYDKGKETHNLDIKVSDMTFMYDIVLKSSFGIFMALSHLRHE